MLSGFKFFIPFQIVELDLRGVSQPSEFFDSEKGALVFHNFTQNHVIWVRSLRTGLRKIQRRRIYPLQGTESALNTHGGQRRGRI